MNLDELRAAVAAGGAGGECRLDEGVHEVTRTIAVAQHGVHLRGPVRGVTTLRRGRLADGSLFAGPLITVADVAGVMLDGFTIDGGRFERSGFSLVDHRHPLTSDRSAAEFTCARQLAAPECYEARSFASGIEADILLVGARDVTLDSISVRSSMTVGIGVGPQCRDVRLQRIDTLQAGQIGLWMGGAFHERMPLPLDEAQRERMPSHVVVEGCRFERSGAAGLFIEALHVEVRDCRFTDNHCDFPFNESGGQLVIDYKCEGVRVENCRIEGASFVERREAVRSGDGWAFKSRVMGAVAIEASGKDLALVGNVLVGAAREAIHINGARGVVLAGGRIEGNHTGGRKRRWFAKPEPGHGVSITTTAEMAHLNAMAADITIEGAHSEGGVLVWSDGSVPNLQVHGIRATGNDFGGGALVVQPSLRGERWEVD